MKRSLITVLALSILIVAPCAIAGGGPDSTGPATYKAKCAMCHGADGAGQTPTGKAMKLRDLRSAEVQKLTDAQLTTMVADGKGKMPAYKSKLSAADIDALVDFMRTMKK